MSRGIDGEKEMDKEHYLLPEKPNREIDPKTNLNTSSREALENELWRSLNKLEHRVEILMTISHDQRAAGRNDLAEAYKNQAVESKLYAQSIRKLLMDLA